MLKKILIGVVIFIILAVAAIGGYIYIMDWNQHKNLVAERFSQITGLKAAIEGDLKVDLFPTPKFSANAVRFFKSNAPRDPLVTVKDISASVELWPMFQHKFIIKSMTLNNASVNVIINEKGVSNWSGINTGASAQPGDIEVSFHDVHMNNAVLNYKNLQDEEEFSLPNISATVNAATIKGPYKTNGKLIYNDYEINFQGSVAKNKNYNINMTFENLPTGSKATIDGSLGKQAKGTVNFRTQHLTDAAKILLETSSLQERYDAPLDFSFQYEYDNSKANLNNFVVKYGNIAAGSGAIQFSNVKKDKEFAINLDMTQMELAIFQSLGQDILDSLRQGKKFADTSFAEYNGELNIKAPHALYNGAEALNVNIGLALRDGLLTVTRMGLNMPGNTAIQLSGALNLNDNLNFQINQLFETDDLRQFISVFGIDIAKLARPENKKSIFKHAQMELSLTGDMNHLKISSPQAIIDTTNLNGNIGFVVNEDKTFVIVDIDGSKILFDKYIEVLPNDIKDLSLKEKFIHQMNLIPWNHELNIDASVRLKGAVYNDIALENMVLEFNSQQNALNVKKLSFDNIAGAILSLNFNADNVYTEPYFSEFTYDIKTDNFPQFTNTLGIKLADLKLLERKRFSSQGALSGNFDNFSLSSVQRFGDAEVLYTGTISNANQDLSFNGEIELKSNNFSNLVQALNFNYQPDLPVTSFTLNGKIAGTSSVFDITDLVAYLSANAIKGSLSVDKSNAKPYFKTELDFDRFDADRLFNLSQKSVFVSDGQVNVTDAFVKKPKLSDEKFNFDIIKNSNFDIKATVQSLIYEGSTYNDAQLTAISKDGVLKVSEFKTVQKDSSIELNFDLNSNDMPKIAGSFKIKELSIPDLAGSIYALQNGIIRTSGEFNSLLTSPKAFFENLSGNGDFILSSASFKGWDFALIKFELEQRDTVDGLEEAILQSLRSGQSEFSEIRGSFDISNGVLVAKNIIWESPVINLHMNFDLNFNNWVFTALFNGVYHNSSFSDVLKFTFDGNLANPKIKTDLSESIARIGSTKKMVSKMKIRHDTAQKNRITEKIADFQEQLTNLQQDISRMEIDVIRFKPVTDNKDVNSVYDANIKTLKEAESSLATINDVLRSHPTEASLREVEADLSTEQSKVAYISKALEDNFVVDSKYVFDNTFNKIAWLYNVAQNNSAYYKGLSDVYLSQLETNEPQPAEGDTPEQNSIDTLTASVQKVSDDMDKITELHTKIRDNYLVIIDTPSVAEMKENNEVAAQALQTISSYVAAMNQDIINSFDLFRAALDIKARDYEQYMVYPPQNPEDIDVSQPTVLINNANEKKSSDEAADTKEPKKEADTEKSSPKSLKELLAPQIDATPDTPDDKKKIDDVTVLEESPKEPVVVLIQPNFEEQMAEQAIGDILNISDIKVSSIELPPALQQTPVQPLANDTSDEDTSLVQETISSNDEVSVEAEMEIPTDTDVASDNIIIAEAPALPDAHTLTLTQASDAAPSAIEKALHTDIDAMLSLIPVDNSESELSVAEHTKLVTDDIAQQLDDLKQSADDMMDDAKDGSGTQLKVNPVIAMDIGRGEADEVSVDLVLKKKKSVFKKAEDAPITAELEENNLTIMPLTTPQREVNAVILDILDTHGVVPNVTYHSSPVVEENTDEETVKYVFAVNPQPTPVSAGGEVIKSMFVGKSILPSIDESAPQFVFAVPEGTELKASGLVDKNMFAHRISDPDEPVVAQKYLFAANAYDTPFSGSVGKSMFTNVK